MKSGRFNIIAGACFIILGMVGGMALGFSAEHSFSAGYYQMSFARFLTRAGHTHGMPMGLYNIIIGIVMTRLVLSDKEKTILAWLGLGFALMPVGLLLRGMTAPAMTFAPVVMLGAISLLGSLVLLIKGAKFSN